MDKNYDPSQIEARWYAQWEKNGDFRMGMTGESYCIMIPPPNVTGSLHMGHAFQDTIMDALTRYHRMKGHATLWQPGTDHAGIATQMVVERQLAAEGSNRHELGRDKFLDKVWAWKAESGGNITRQLRRMGASVDWERERFTMDAGLSKAVTEVFVKLHAEGLIYRGKRLVNWDPILKTAVSDLEVEAQEENGHLWHFRYPLSDGSGHVTVATTRPETMLGDSAVAVHPEDERYRALIGKTVRLPLVEREIPVIADDYVDKDFGTGVVKITPAHDFNDYEMGQRHQLPLINILNDDASINEVAPEKYRGMDRFVARQAVVADLEALGLLAKVDDHTLMVPRGDRTHQVLEPYLTDQWFVKAAPLAQPAIEAVESGRIRFVPENWSKTYFEWMRNIQDWCISRQIWWGHRIPAWYDDDGQVYVGRDEAEVRQLHQLPADRVLRQDEDVLDTWFSSALWPFSTLGWPERTAELAKHYPTSVLVTGFDIIFFWVARMIMMGLKFMDDVPFREVYVHGLVRDASGAKMSKSKGNVIDPLDIVDGITLDALLSKRTSGMMQPQLAQKIAQQTRTDFPEGIPSHGTDALRFYFAALASTGRDIRFDTQRLAGYKNFCNKLWNAARYVNMMVAEHDLQAATVTSPGIAERWICSKMNTLITSVNQHYAIYRFDLIAAELHEFVWHHFCDWYLELSKPVLQHGEDPAGQLATARCLVSVLETILRLLHPIMPFITEEIWQGIGPLAGKSGTSLMHQPFPSPDADAHDAQAEDEIDWLQQSLLGLRQIRGEMDISPGKPLDVLVADAQAQDETRLQKLGLWLKALGRIQSLSPAGEQPPESAIAMVGQMKLLVPMAGLIDKDAELARLDKRIAKLGKEVAAAEAKLNNPAFVAKAPENVVASAREQAERQRQALTDLRNQHARISAL